MFICLLVTWFMMKSKDFLLSSRVKKILIVEEKKNCFKFIVSLILFIYLLHLVYVFMNMCKKI